MSAKLDAAIRSDRRCGPGLLITMALIVVVAMVALVMMRSDVHQFLPSKSAAPAVTRLPKN